MVDMRGATSRVLALTGALGALSAQAAGGPWHGPFVGLHGGHAQSGTLELGTRAVPSAVFKDLQGAGEQVRADGELQLGGAIGGVHGGYLRQYGAAVYGLEASWSRLDLEKTVYDDVVCANVNLCATDDRFESQLRSLALVCLRAGRSLGASLLYLRAGFALGHHELEITDDNLNTFGRPSSGLNTGSTRGSEWLQGHALGLGVDHRLSERLSLGLSYDDVHFPATELDTAGAGVCSPTTTSPLCAGRLGQTVPGQYPMELERLDLHRLALRLELRF